MWLSKFKQFNNLKMGEKGGKADMDRVGLFQEMGYVTISDRYKRPGHG